MPVPKARLLRVAVEAKMKPELRRLSLLHAAAAEISGFPDWNAGFTHAQLMDRTTHSSVFVGDRMVTYQQDSGNAEDERRGLSALSRALFEKLQVSQLTRLGHRRWYFLPLDMDLQQALDLFSLRHSPQEDPIWHLGHRVRGLLHRVESTDADGWHWNIMTATIPRGLLPAWLGYDLEAHWEPNRAAQEIEEFLRQLPEVGLSLDLDCYRQEELPIDEWEPFVARSREKIERTAGTLAASYFSQEK
jgi:hypothetical protein